MPEEPSLHHWTIKSMPDKLTADAVSYARRHQMSVAELVAESLRLRLGQPPVQAVRRRDLPEALPVEALVALVTSPHVQRWLRAAAARELAVILDVKFQPPPRRQITVTVEPKAAPEAPEAPTYE